MPKLGLSLTVAVTRIGGGAAPTTLPFGAATPTLYFSGLVMPDGGGWTGMYYDNSWSWFAGFSQYLSNSGAGLFYWDNNGGSKWTYYARGMYTDYGIELMRPVCTNPAPSGDIPLIGWVNEAGITGSLIIKTSP